MFSLEGEETNLGGDISTYEDVRFCNDYRVSNILRIGVKFSRWGKNPPHGHKRDKTFWVQLLTSTIQLLCINIPGTLLHVTLKRRAEISTDIFSPSFAVFPLLLTLMVYSLFKISPIGSYFQKLMIKDQLKLILHLYINGRIKTWERIDYFYEMI